MGSKDANIDAVVAKLAEDRGDYHKRLHAEWLSSGKDPEKLQPLINEFRPLLERKRGDYSGGARMLMPQAIDASLMIHFVNALHSYDPTKAGLNTHVQNRLQSTLRDVIRSQNVARIPEDVAANIGKVQRAQASLQDELGRKPTDSEIATRAGLTPKGVQGVLRRLVADIPSGSFESDAVHGRISRDSEVLPLLREHLKPETQRVFDTLFHPTNPVLGTGDIARRLGMDEPTVSKHRTAIVEAYNKFKLPRPRPSP